MFGIDFSQPSTWRGVISILSFFGVALSPEQATAIIALGMGVNGVIGAFFRDAKKV